MTEFARLLSYLWGLLQGLVALQRLLEDGL